MIDGKEVELEYFMYNIVTTEFSSDFFGTHLKHMETENWHYYKMIDGSILHFRKEYMALVKQTPVSEEEFEEAEKQSRVSKTKLTTVKRKQ